MSLKFSLLALLYQREMHGYEVARQLPALLRSDWDFPPGQIATTLARLEKAHLVSFHTESGDDAPDRKIYQLTPAGLSELRAWFLTPEVRDYRLGDSFYLKLVFSLTGSPVAAQEVIYAQRRRLYEELHDVTRLRQQVDPQTDLPWLLLLETAIMHLDADIRWLDMCEARLPDLERFQPHITPAPPRGRPRKPSSFEPDEEKSP
jgi:DNA-binding PadR family transcriptional regulator